MTRDTGLFISYNREVMDFVDKFADVCDIYQLVYWLDRRRLIVGEDWPRKIDEAIERCRAFVVVISPHVFTSAAVKHEIEVAQQHHKPIIYVYNMPLHSQLLDGYADLALFRIAGTMLLNDTHYEFLRQLREHDLLVTTEAYFLPYLVMAYAAMQKSDRTWQVFNERLHHRFMRNFFLNAHFLVMGSVIALFFLKVRLSAQQLAVIPGLIEHGNQPTLLNILLTLALLVLLVASILALVVVIAPYFFAGRLETSLPYARMREARRIPDIAVLTPRGVVVRSKLGLDARKEQSATFADDSISFLTVQKMEISRSMLRGLELICTLANRTTKRIMIPTSVGLTEKKLRRFIKGFKAVPVEAAPTISEDTLAPALLDAKGYADMRLSPHRVKGAITIFCASKTKQLAQMIAEHLAGRGTVTVVNVDHENPLTATFLSASLVVALPHAQIYSPLNDALLKWVLQERLLLVPIRVESSMASIFQSMQWVDLSAPSFYSLGLAHIDYALYSNGVLPRPGSNVFLPEYQLAEAIYGKPDFPVYKVERRWYRFSPWTVIWGVGFTLLGFLPEPLTPFFWLIGFYLLMTATILGGEVGKARQLLGKNETLPEIVAISPTGAVFSWRNFWLHPKQQRLEYLPATDYKSLSIFDIPLFFHLISFKRRGSRKRIRIVLPHRRFNFEAIKATLLAEREGTASASKSTD